MFASLWNTAAEPTGLVVEKPSPWRQTLQYLVQLEKENPSEALDTGQRCVAAFARSGDYDALQRVFEQLRALRLEPDAIPAFTALSTLAQTGAWRDAAALLRALRDVQVKVQLVAHHRLLGAMHSAGHWQGVVTCLDGIKRSSYRPDIFSFGLALAARDPGSSWRGAVAFLGMLQDESLEASQARSARLDGVTLLHLLWSSFIQRSFSTLSSQVQDFRTLALHFCAGMHFQSLASTRGFSSAISACENLSQWRQVSMLLRHMSGAMTETIFRRAYGLSEYKERPEERVSIEPHLQQLLLTLQRSSFPLAMDNGNEALVDRVERLKRERKEISLTKKQTTKELQRETRRLSRFKKQQSRSSHRRTSQHASNSRRVQWQLQQQKRRQRHDLRLLCLLLLRGNGAAKTDCTAE
eukprot:s5201_g8.t1